MDSQTSWTTYHLLPRLLLFEVGLPPTFAIIVLPVTFIQVPIETLQGSTIPSAQCAQKICPTSACFNVYVRFCYP